MDRSNDESAGRSPMRRRGASRNEQRQEARVAWRRVEWLLGPLVYWAGSPPARETVPGSVYRPVSELLGRRFAGLPAGLYAVNPVWCEPGAPASEAALRAMGRRVNPRVLDVRRIGEREVSEAARSLRGIARHADALGEILGADVEALRRRAETVFPRLTAALNSGGLLDSGAPAALAIEEACWWIGPEAVRPSRRTSDERLRSWLGRAGDVGHKGRDAGWQAGWLLAGQRRLRFKEMPDDAAPWYRLGSAFPIWPLDVLIHGVAAVASKGVESWMRWARTVGVASGAGAAFVREAWWGATGSRGGDVLQGLARIPSLTTSIERAGGAWERRGHAVRGILLEAVKQARNPALRVGDRSRSAEGAGGDAGSTTDDDDTEWVRRVAKGLRRRRRGVRVTLRGTAMLRNLIGRLLRTRLGLVPDPGCLDRVARMLREVESGSGEDLFEVCSQLVAPKAEGLAAGWIPTWSGLAGRLWAWGQEGGMGWLAGWIRHLDDRMSPGARFDRALRAALHLVELWSGASERNAANLARLGEVLATEADKVIEWVRLEAEGRGAARGILTQQQVRWMLAHPVCHVAKLGRLPAEDARFLVHTALLRRTVALVNRRPDRLGAYVAFLRGMTMDLDRGGPGAQWAWLFAATDDAFLAWALVQRERWLAGGAVVEWQAAALLTEVVDLADSHPGLGRFLVRNTALLDRVLASALRQPTSPPTAAARDFWADLGRRFSARTALLELAAAWVDKGFADPDSLVDVVLRWWEEVEGRQASGGDEGDEPRFLSFPGWTVESVLVLSEGEVGRVCGILLLAGAAWFRWDWIEAGWKYLGGIPGARALVREAWDGRLGARAALELVGRFGLGTRLWIGPELDHGMAAWLRAEEPRGVGGPTATEVALPAELSRELARVESHRKVAGRAGALPGDLAALLDRPDRWREERDRLKAMMASGDVPTAAKRLSNLEARLRTPDAIASWLVKDLRRALPKSVFLARWESLSAVVDRALRRHWRRQFAISAPQTLDDDWQNALLLGSELTSNKALWRRLVRHEATGDRTWRWNHPGNRTWIRGARSAGIDTDRWLGSHAWTGTRGGEPWRIHAEDNPLRVLQMGNWFDTCLQRSGINNFSAVTNAVEANKRVLYLTNHRGAVIGRKLVASMPDDGRGVLIGFRSYGATVGWRELSAGKAAGPWAKIRFDLCCARLARDVGAWLGDAGEATVRLADRCGLFAEWYNDGIEPFDWWVAGAQYWADDGDEPLRDAVLIEAVARFGREKEDARLATWRALVWLGEDARPFWESVDPETLPEAERRHLAPTAAALGLRW